MILGALLLRVGADPFVAGLQHTTPATVLAATVVTLLTTVCSAWRWSLVAARLGVMLPMRPAVAAYYRSQFVNATLPGGVLGDVHRAVRHGREAGHLGLGARGVAWERVIGLVVYVASTLLVVAVLPSPLRPLALVVLGAAAVGLAVVLALRHRRRRSRRGIDVSAASPAVRRPGGRMGAVRVVAADCWSILGRGSQRWGIVLASVAVAAGHTSVFVLAARAAGVSTPTVELVPVAMTVLVVAVIPLNVAGWGPREAIAAAAFATVGLGAEQGVTVAVVYGVLALLATLPGAVLLFAQRATHRAQPTGGAPAAGIETVTVGGAAHG